MSRSERRISLAEPSIGGNAARYLEECLSTNFVSSVGPFVSRFEGEFAAYVGTRYAVACASGTAALHLALRALDVGPGDEVFVPTLTFVASANPVRYEGATPVLVDSDDQSLGMDPELVVEEIERRASGGRPLPKAIEVVHLVGHPADLAPILEVADRHGIPVIEDAAEALGATWTAGPLEGRQVGSVGRIGCFSFNGNKIITTTGGGMVIADDPAAIARMRKWATQAREPALEYLHKEIGHNYRLSNVLAAIGRGQLRVLDLRVQQRRAVFDRYAAAFVDLPGIRMQPEAPWGTHTRWLSVAYIDVAESGLTAPELIGALDRANIESRPVWRPMHTQPIYAGALSIGGEVAERLYRTGICLPSTSSLSAGDQDRVIDAVRRAVLEARGTRQRVAAPVSRAGAASS